MTDLLLTKGAQTPISQRETQFDYLRVLSAIAVITIHVCAMDWRRIDVTGSRWFVIHVFDMVCKFSVPVFFMISGRFFLDPERNVCKEKLTQKIIHIVTAFLFWSAVYTILNIFRMAIVEGQPLKDNLAWIIIEFFGGEYHMWYLYAIGALYLITPFLRVIVKDKRLTEYFLVLYFFLGIMSETLCSLPKVGVIFTTVFSKAELYFVLGYSGYYVLGYYLHQYPPKDRLRKIIYLLGVVGTGFSVIATWVASVESGTANEALANYLTPNVVLSAAAVYVFVCSKYKNKKPNAFISKVSEYSFGIYLAHPLILWIFDFIGVTPARFLPVISVPIMVSITLVLSFFLAWLTKNIPQIGKHVV